MMAGEKGVLLLMNKGAGAPGREGVGAGGSGGFTDPQCRVSLGLVSPPDSMHCEGSILDRPSGWFGVGCPQGEHIIQFLEIKFALWSASLIAAMGLAACRA
jgi:hypothetical protein